MLSRYPLLIVVVLFFSSVAFAESELAALAKTAVNGDESSSVAAIKDLRKSKQTGLDAVFEAYHAEISEMDLSGKKAANWDRISFVLDSVAMQKDAYSSRLFWHTDLDAAKKEAADSNKPILSLRLLGGLNEEYSCANSRFFRSILYSDPAIAKTLREKYILHWKSVRPAPRITIDFGDGRKLVRTITGNSIHYILDSTGRIVDALPGLYAPDVFDRYLLQMADFAGKPEVSQALAADYRLRTTEFLIAEWNKRITFLGNKQPGPEPNTGPASVPETNRPLAIDAAPRAMTKMAVERSAVLSLLPQIERLRNKTGVNDWKPLAGLGGKIEFSAASLRLIRSKSGAISESEFSKLIQNLQDYVAIDTVQNEYRFHTTILTWLNPVTAEDLDAFNEQVYSQLFLTPSSDKWLGLYSPDIYSAIVNNGLVR